LPVLGLNNRLHITYLEHENEFLRTELKSKNLIIQMILENQQPTITPQVKPPCKPYEEEHPFIYPKNVTKRKKTIEDINFTSNNKFQALYNDYEEFEEDNSIDRNFNEENKSKKRTRNRNKKDKKEATKTVIVGDSIIKGIYGGDLSKNLKNNKHVIIKSVSGAKTFQMHDYIRPTVNEKPDELIIQPSDIAKGIINLAKSVKPMIKKVSISGIVPRNDKYEGKPEEVNDILKTLCYENNFDFISHCNIDSYTNTNSKGLHLNHRGIKNLKDNFLKYLDNG